MTAVSAIVFFLGLLFGFQRPSRLLPPRLCATVLLAASLHPIQPGVCILYFEAAFLSSGRCRCLPTASPRLDSTSRRCALFLPVEGGAEPTSLPLPLSTRFVDSFFHLTAAFAVSRGGGFYYHRVGSQLRSPTSYFVFHFFRPGPSSPVRRRLSVRGARLLPPPRWESTAFVDPLLPAHLASSPLRLPPCRGARLLSPPR